MRRRDRFVRRFLNCSLSVGLGLIVLAIIVDGR